MEVPAHVVPPLHCIHTHQLYAFLDIANDPPAPFETVKLFQGIEQALSTPHTYDYEYGPSYSSHHEARARPIS